MEGMTMLESLMYYRIGWQTESYVKKAIELLIDQSKDSSLKDLLTALSTNGKTNTPCVTITRPQGRYGVFGQFPDGAYPHVIFAKIWRWPEVRFEELRSLPHCTCGFDLRKVTVFDKMLICVNPYHYERIDVPFSCVNAAASKSTAKQSVHITKNFTVMIPRSTKGRSSNAVVAVSVRSNASATDKKEPETDKVASDQSNDELLDMLTTTFDCPLLLPSTNDPSSSNASQVKPEPEKTAGLSMPSLDILDLSKNSVVSVPSPSASPLKDSDAGSSTASQPSVVNQLAANDDNTGAESSRDRSGSSTSISSDDGFEIINYDMDVDDLNDAAETETPSMARSVTENRSTRNELTGCETITKTSDNYSTTSPTQNTWNDAEKSDGDEFVKSFEDDFVEDVMLKQIEKPAGKDLPISFEHCLGEEIIISPDLILCETDDDITQHDGTNNSCAAENNIQTVDMETENCDSKTTSESADEWKKKYEKLRDEHEKLKIAFVEAGFAASNVPTQKLRCKEMQKLMDGVKTQFEGPSKSAGQYRRLKKIVDNGADGFIATGSPKSSGSSSSSHSPCASTSKLLTSLLSPDKPYCRKIKVTIRNKTQTLTHNQGVNEAQDREIAILDAANNKVLSVHDIPPPPNSVVTVTTPSASSTTSTPAAFAGPSTSTGVGQCGPFYFTGLPSSGQPAVVVQKTNPTGTAALPRPTIPLQLIAGPPQFSFKVKEVPCPAVSKESKKNTSSQLPKKSDQPVTVRGPDHSTKEERDQKELPMFREKVVNCGADLQGERKTVQKPQSPPDKSALYKKLLLKTQLKRLKMQQTLAAPEYPQPVAGPSHQQPTAAPMQVPKQAEVKEEKMDEGEIRADQNNEAQLQAEVATLRKRVVSLEAQLEMQKQDEMEKMKCYTNSMREHYMQTVNRLNESNKELSEQLAQKEIDMVNQIDPQEVTTLLDDKDREINNLNDHLLSLCALLTANEDEILQLKNEKRTVKRNSESEESDEEISLKRRPDDQKKVESNQEPLIPQVVFDYLCAELEKSTMKTSEENKNDEDATNQEGASSDSAPSNDNLPPSGPREINALTTSIRDIEERERVMAARFSEVIAQLEVMKITHDKTKSDLEARLKNGAKQYAKLYLKYDKLKKGNPSESNE